MRIISTVPSQTELLSYLGLEEQLVGITKFCVYPPHVFSSKQRIGGTKTLKTTLIKSLAPDLILANKEENVKEQVTILQSEFKTYVSDVKDLPSALKMIRAISQLCNRKEKGDLLCQSIQDAFMGLTPMKSRLDTLYLIWKDPFMTVGNDTFIHDMMYRCGFRNVMGSVKRYPEVEIEQVRPALILLSSEPFPFSEKHISELKERFPEAKIMCVDGTYFSWYGSRLLEAPAYFRKIIDAIEP